ncbi:MAG: hypothetical protein R3F61_32655 [Myxococcota bacterium]
MTVAVLVKGRYETLAGARTKSVGPNVLEIEIPMTPEIMKRTRRGGQAEDWDGAMFLVNDVEAEPAVGSGETPTSVRVTVFFLGGLPKA